MSKQFLPYRELTWAAVLLGIFQGIILNLAFVYAALKLGFSIGGSTVAAITGYAVLKGAMGKGTIVENNLNQTIASGINTAGTGIVFTFPALLMLNAKWQSEGIEGITIQPIPFLIAGVAGSILGVILIIPLHKQMIELDRLRFPSGVAVTTILRSGATGVDKAKLLVCGAVIAGLWKLIMITGILNSPGILEADELNLSFGIIPDYFSPVIYLSLMNLAAGMLAAKGGLPFLGGGLLAWWFISPLAVSLGWVPEILDGPDQLGFIYGKMIRPLGIGTLVGGALMGVVMAFPAIKSALKSLGSAATLASKDILAPKREELPLPVLIFGLVFAVVMFYIASILTPGVTQTQAILSAVVGTLWLGVAGLIVAQATGMTDLSPMSGMALISVTLMMFMLNNNIAAAMVVGIAVCVAIGQGADMMQDLKTGFMVGSKPIKQQVVQFGVTWIGALLALGSIYLLWTSGPGGAGGFGEGTDLPAPQAGALMGIINAVSTGQVPVDKYVLGGLLGALLGSAPYAGLGVLVGLAMYLPFSITFGYGIGALIAMRIQAKKGAAFCENKLVPFAAGLIVGEALIGIGDAAYEIMF